MLKHLSILMISAALAFSVGCTSQKATEDESVATEGSGDLDESAELDLDSEQSTAELGSDELDLNEKLPEEQATPDSLVENTPTEEPAPTEATSQETMTEAAPPIEEPMAESTPPPVVEVAPTPPPMDEAPKPVATLKKIRTEPFKEAGTLVNAVYVARDGDTWAAVSQKVYGGDRVKELKKINSSFKKRELKVGDKVYYNSPLRPTDDVKMLTFYEDAGVPSSTYTAKSGDDLKAVGKTLLGHDRSWIELWTTNLTLDSKGELAEATEIRYWPASDVAMPTQTMAQAPAELPPPEQPMEQAPPQQDMAQTDLPPPPTPAEEPQAAGTVEPPPPPPPPPPAPPVENVKPQTEMAAGEPNETMALGVGAILLLAAVAMFIVIRKKKARRQLEFNTGTHTQIE